MAIRTNIRPRCCSSRTIAISRCVTVASPNFFKNMKPLEVRRHSGARIDRLGLRLSDRRRTHVGHDRHCFANRFPALHPFVDRLSISRFRSARRSIPGNSGGPVMQNAKVVGVAFQGYSGDVAQGVAYMIPTPVIQRFLKDIEDGHYDQIRRSRDHLFEAAKSGAAPLSRLEGRRPRRARRHGDRRRAVRRKLLQAGRRAARDRRSSDRERCHRRTRRRAGGDAGSGRAKIQGRQGEARSLARQAADERR